MAQQMADERVPGRLLRPQDVAEIFGVEPRTVTRWAEEGRLEALRTPGGHRRFRESDVRALLVEARSGT